MFKHYFERIQDIEVYPIISLLIFVLFFVSLLVWVLRVDKKYVRTMENLPLAEDPQASQGFTHSTDINS
jgi:cytochrome c oxidase cbb3-type subunit IV